MLLLLLNSRVEIFFSLNFLLCLHFKFLLGVYLLPLGFFLRLKNLPILLVFLLVFLILLHYILSFDCLALGNFPFFEIYLIFLSKLDPILNKNTLMEASLNFWSKPSSVFFSSISFWALICSTRTFLFLFSLSFLACSA